MRIHLTVNGEIEVDLIKLMMIFMTGEVLEEKIDAKGYMRCGDCAYNSSKYFGFDYRANLITFNTVKRCPSIPFIYGSTNY